MSHRGQLAICAWTEGVLRLLRRIALAMLVSALIVLPVARAQGTCMPPTEPRPGTGAVSPDELAALPGAWRIDVTATRGRWGLNQRPDSLGRATFFLRLRVVEASGAASPTVGLRPDSLRPLTGQRFPSARMLGALDTIPPDSSADRIWMFGRTLYAGHPGGSDAVYDAFELTSVDSVQLRGRFFRSWGIAIPLGVSGDSAREPAGYFCASRPTEAR